MIFVCKRNVTTNPNASREVTCKKHIFELKVRRSRDYSVDPENLVCLLCNKTFRGENRSTVMSEPVELWADITEECKAGQLNSIDTRELVRVR